MRRRKRQRENTDWWQNQAGEWMRDTPNGDPLARVLDRFAESFVRGDIEDAGTLERQIDYYLQYGYSPYVSPFTPMKTILLP